MHAKTVDLIAVSRKTLVFLCLSVASVVFTPIALANGTVLYEVTPQELGGFDSQGYNSRETRWRTSDSSVTGNVSHVCYYLGSTAVSGSGEYAVTVNSVNSWQTYTSASSSGTGVSTPVSWTVSSSSELYQNYCFELPSVLPVTGSEIYTFSLNKTVDILNSDSLEYLVDYGYVSGTGLVIGTNSNGAIWVGKTQAIIFTDGEIFPEFSIDPTNNIEYGSQYETRFTETTFPTNTNDVEIDVSYFISPTEATTTQADKNPTLLRFRYSLASTTSFSAQSFQITDSVNPTYGNGTTTAILDLLPNSKYEFNVQFANGGTAITGVVPFPLAYIYFTVETDSNGGVATTSTLEFYDAVQQQAWDYQPCGVTDIGGCITNAFLFTFAPSTESLQRFTSLSTQLENRIPFVYAYQLPTYWDALFDTAQSHSLSISATTSIGHIDFISESQLEAIPLTATIKSIIGYLLYIMLAFTLYYRVMRLFNPNDAK